MISNSILVVQLEDIPSLKLKGCFNFTFKVGVTAFMDLFKVSPESTQAFAFLKHYTTDNEEFYELLSKHSLRVLGIVSVLIKEVIYK